MQRRADTGLLASMWELPNDLLPDAPETGEPCGEAVHIFSHVEWHMTGYAISLEETENMDQEGLLFVDVKETEEHYPIPAAFAAYAEYLNISLGQEKN